MLKRHTVDKCSLRSRLLSAVLRRTLKRMLTSRDYDPVASRQRLQNGLPERRTARGVSVFPVAEESVTGEWQIPEQGSGKTCLFYLHGGGYVLGSPGQYRGMTSRLAQLSGSALFSLDYRLAPEYAFPAPVTDALLAYRWLLKQWPAERIVVMGDSAGGGLALALIHALKDRNLPLPGGAVVFSPYADLLATGDSILENSDSCAMFRGESIPFAAEFYLQGANARSPLASPFYGDFADFPPLCIYVSDSEIIRDDGLRIAAKADAAGVSVLLNLWHKQPHAWPAFYPLLPEADKCLREVAQLIRTEFASSELRPLASSYLAVQAPRV